MPYHPEGKYIKEYYSHGVKMRDEAQYISFKLDMDMKSTPFI
jgi:hypothetical protein